MSASPENPLISLLKQGKSHVSASRTLKNQILFSSILPKSRKEVENQDKTHVRETSYTEYEVDALALKAEEGRGDRRNVQGELHASNEP
jgi:hypothetical protein